MDVFQAIYVLWIALGFIGWSLCSIIRINAEISKVRIQQYYQVRTKLKRMNLSPFMGYIRGLVFGIALGPICFIIAYYILKSENAEIEEELDRVHTGYDS